MTTDWYAYKTKAGNTIFFYNTRTGEHRWANKCASVPSDEPVDHKQNDINGIGNCASSKATCTSTSHWRPYTLKSGEISFYYNIITGEHKWDLSSDLSNSSIPSEPVVLKEEDDVCSHDDRDVDLNGNTVSLATADRIEIKKEHDQDVFDDETQNSNDTNFVPTNSTEDEADSVFPMERSYSQTNTPEIPAENQFLREIVDVQPNRNFMTLRSTSRKNSISYVSEKENSVNNEELDEEFLSDVGSESSSDEDSCSNFSDELPEISESESEDEDIRKTKQKKSKCNSANLNEKLSCTQNSDRIVNGNALVGRNFNARHEVEVVQEGIPLQSLANLVKNMHGMNGISNIQEACKTSGTNDTVLSPNREPESRVTPFCSANHEAMPKIDGIFKIADNKLIQVNLEYPKAVDSTALSIYQRNSEFRYETSQHGYSSWQNLQNSKAVLNVAQNKERYCSSLNQSEDNESIPKIDTTFSVSNNRENLAMSNVNFEKVKKRIDNTTLETATSNSMVRLDQNLEACNENYPSTFGESQETRNAQSDEVINCRRSPSTNAVSLEASLGVDRQSSKPTSCRGSKNDGQGRESVDITSKIIAFETDSQVKSKHPSKLSGFNCFAEKEPCSSIDGPTRETNQHDSNNLEPEEDILVKSIECHQSLNTSSDSLTLTESNENNDQQLTNSMCSSQQGQQAMTLDQTEGNSTISAADPRLFENDEATTSSQEEKANSNNFNYRYHYSIKCLLPMTGVPSTQGNIESIGCDNRRPAISISSQYLRSHETITPPLTPIFAGSGKDDLMTPLNIGSIAQEQSESITAVSDMQSSSLPTINEDNLRETAASVLASNNMQSEDLSTDFNKNDNDLLKCLNTARTLSGIPQICKAMFYTRYRCCYCSKDFGLHDELKRHLALRHLMFGGVFSCHSCDDSFLALEEFNQHLLLHDEVKPLTCRHCKTDFLTMEELADHISVHVDDPKYPKYQNKKAICEMVDENLDKDAEKESVNSEHKEHEKRRNCKFCEKSFKHFFAFRLHLKTHSEVENYTCLLCGKWYLDLTSLRKHVVIHLREKRLECDICHKVFRFHNDYLQHQLVHVNGQSFLCEKRGCRKVFPTWEELRQHHVVVHEEKRFSCTECGKTFSRCDKLREHVRLHTGAKPNECEKCGRRFRTKTILRNHKRIHLETKMFKCEICEKSFKQKCSMLRHAKTHNTGVKEYPCSLCKKRFTQSCSLQRHLRIHSGDRFKCPSCPLKFIEAWRMREHIKKKHSDVKMSQTLQPPN